MLKGVAIVLSILADLAASFSTDSSKRLFGVFERSFSTGFVSFEERRRCLSAVMGVRSIS